MTFEIHDLPSGAVLFKGRLVQKKLAAKAKRSVMLCFPSSVQDIEVLHQLLTIPKQEQEEEEEYTNKNMEIYGHLSLAAISGIQGLMERLSFIYRWYEC